MASIYAAICLSSVYEYAKENSGPLKLGVQTVEGTVKTVIGPVYEKFHDVPFKFLKFVDHKVSNFRLVINPIFMENLYLMTAIFPQVGKSITEAERHVPSPLRHASSQAFTAAQKAPEVARAVVSEIQRDGVVDATKNITKNVYTKYEPTAKEIYSKYEPVAEQYVVSAWHALNRLPLFPQVAELLIPTAAHWSDKYNRAVSYMAEKNYTAAMYLPLIPKARIAKIFEEGSSVSTNIGEEISAAQ